MSSVRTFGAVIGAAGGKAYILRDGAELEITVSIQPMFHDREGQGSSLGTGVHERFRAYIAIDDNAGSIVRGEILRWKDSEYLVRRIETVYYADSPVYRKASLVVCVAGEDKQ